MFADLKCGSLMVQHVTRLETPRVYLHLYFKEIKGKTVGSKHQGYVYICILRELRE